VNSDGFDNFIAFVMLITLHNEELHNLYPSPSIIRVIKSRRLEWAGHVAKHGTDEKYIHDSDRKTLA
jgi:hypothetical protein